MFYRSKWKSITYDFLGTKTFFREEEGVETLFQERSGRPRISKLKTFKNRDIILQIII